MSYRGLKAILVEDDMLFGKVISHALEKEDVEVEWVRDADSFLAIAQNDVDLVILDYNLPDSNGIELLKTLRRYQPTVHTIVLSGQETVQVVVEAYDNGANGYIMKNENAIHTLLRSLATIKDNFKLRKEVEKLREDIIDRNKYSNIAGESGAVLKVLKMIQKVENSKILTLITGESGTGKELVAKAIHYNSNRKKYPFVAVNIAAIPDDLIESELFGHEKGAFTGAAGKRIGAFEESNGGTIFLDEIGELDMNIQTKLLRVLQENKISRLGNNKEVDLDLRIVAATNKNLAQLVREGKLREDFYYRLQGFIIQLPPLRERENDVILLAKSFLKEFCEKNRMQEKHLSKDTLISLLDHRWPGNVRELKSLIERAALISDNNEIGVDDIMFSEV